MLCIASLTGISPEAAQAAPPSDLQDVRLVGQVALQVDDLEAQAAHLQAEIEALDLDLEKASEAYNQLQVRLDELNVAMADLRRELATAQSDHAYRIKKLE
ncbi:MAG: hypothetical protein EHM57_08595, partial [Actinobacteria bacterium]